MRISCSLNRKFITVTPGIGNVVNGVIAASTTAALGAYLIDKTEEMDADRRRKQKLDGIIKKWKDKE